MWLKLVLLIPTGLAAVPQATFHLGLCGARTRRGLVVATTQRFYEETTGKVYVPTRRLVLGTEESPLPDGYAIIPPEEEVCSLEGMVGCPQVTFYLDPANLKLSRHAVEFERFAEVKGYPSPQGCDDRRRLFQMCLLPIGGGLPKVGGGRPTERKT